MGSGGTWSDEDTTGFPGAAENTVYSLYYSEYSGILSMGQGSIATGAGAGWLAMKCFENGPTFYWSSVSRPTFHGFVSIYYKLDWEAVATTSLPYLGASEAELGIWAYGNMLHVNTGYWLLPNDKEYEIIHKELLPGMSWWWGDYGYYRLSFPVTLYDGQIYQFRTSLETYTEAGAAGLAQAQSQIFIDGKLQMFVIHESVPDQMTGFIPL